MEKLKQIIEQYSRWQPLDTYILRLEGYVQSDFSIAIENAKSLLETIGKEICMHHSIDVDKSASVNAVLKKAFSTLGYSSSHPMTQISSSLATIGQNVGNIRNDVGTTSHGKTLDELRERNQKVDDLTREFLIDSTEIIACFLIRNFEKEAPKVSNKDREKRLLYLECETFNDFWDDTFGEFEMGEYSYPASEILFQVDYKAYETEFKAFETTEE